MLTFVIGLIIGSFSGMMLMAILSACKREDVMREETYCNIR